MERYNGACVENGPKEDYANYYTTSIIEKKNKPKKNKIKKNYPIRFIPCADCGKFISGRNIRCFDCLQKYQNKKEIDWRTHLKELNKQGNPLI